MVNISQVIACLDKYIEQKCLESITAIEGGKILEKHGILKDSIHRPGLPLRNLLRAKKIPHAYQLGGKGSRWVIPTSKKK